MQQTLIIILLEFMLQIKTLMEGKFLEGNSVVSDRSYSAELEQQSKQQGENSKNISRLLVALLLLNVVFFGTIFMCTQVDSISENTIILAG